MPRSPAEIMDEIEELIPDLSVETARHMRWLLQYARLLKQDNDELHKPRCGKCASYQGRCQHGKAECTGKDVDPGTDGCVYFD